MNGTEENKQLIVKSNILVESSYRLTTREQRLILFMASKVKKDDADFHPYRVQIKEFTDIVGLDGKANYREVKKLTKRLLERVITIKTESGDLQIGWVSSAEYHDRKGFVELDFDPKLKPYLLKIKKFFTKYQLSDVIRLKGFYSIRLYELLKQYEKIGKRTFDLTELRAVLGIRKNEYKLYGHLKNKVIAPAQRELSEKCDLAFEFREVKESRKVVGVEFLIVPHEIDEAGTESAAEAEHHLHTEERAKAQKAREEAGKRAEQQRFEYEEFKRKEIEEHKRRFSKEDIELIEKGIAAEVEREREGKTHGMKTFIRFAVESHFAKRAGVPPFDAWRQQHQTDA